MTRKISLTLALVLVLPLSSCQKDEDKKSKAEPVVVRPEQSKLEVIQAAPKGEYRALVLSIYGVVIEWYEAKTKWFEYRKAFPKQPISHLVFYNTATHEIMGYAPIVQTLVGDPEEIVRETGHRSGTEPENLLEYYKGYKKGYATEVKYFSRLPEPLSLQQAKELGFNPSPNYQLAEYFPKLNEYLKAQIELDEHDLEP